MKNIDDMIQTQNEIKQELFIMRNHQETFYESHKTTENRETTENSKPKSYASAVSKESERVPSRKHDSKRKDTNHERNSSRSKDFHPRRHSQRYQNSHESRQPNYHRSVNTRPQYYRPRFPRSSNSPYIPYRHQREGFGLAETERDLQYMPPQYRRTDDRLYSFPRQRNHRQQYENLSNRPYNYRYNDYYRNPHFERYFETPVSNRFSVLGN